MVTSLAPSLSPSSISLLTDTSLSSSSVPVPILGQRHCGWGVLTQDMGGNGENWRILGCEVHRERWGKAERGGAWGWAFFWGFPAVPPPLPLHQPPESPRRQAPRWSGSIGWSGVATYLGDLPVGHKGGQGLAHAPLLVRAQVLGGHLDAHLERKSKVDD